MNHRTRLLIQAGLIAVAVVLALLIYRSIMQPVRFQREKSDRSAVLVQRMKDIRKVQQEHKKAFGCYIATGDSLINFLKEGTIPYVKMIGTVPDSLTEDEAIEKGIVSRETFLENAFTVLFPEHEGDKELFLSRLMMVPFNKEGKKISMEAGFISRSGYQVPVFEAMVSFEDLLEGMDEQLIVNEVAQAKTYNRYPGIKMGSMTEPITEGNWE
ncbi:MAG: hypothetical protein K2L50_02755 [Bacteroidales bacterium]|nr:hypothetical protein [Bacteroidales bacterium]